MATPPGESAIAVVRVSGDLSEKIARDAFRLIENPQARHASFGRYFSISGELIDECLYVFFNDKSSYTGEFSLEIYSHGNPFIQKRIFEDLIKRGCRCAEPGEFTKRAFLNGKIDLSQAEAVEELIRARSERALSAAHKLLSGELGKRISLWNDEILSVLAEIESQIDFSDEDLPVFHVEHFRKKISDLMFELKRTEDSAKYSSKVHEGLNVVIVGAPNAGKSSLMNRLVGSERAIVSPEAGTTRDFISENITIGRHHVRIIDTAGIRSDASTEIEKSGINRAVDCVKNGDFYLLVVDGSVPPPAMSESLTSLLSPEKTLLVINKSDLPSAFSADPLLPEIEKIFISLLESSSVDRLKEKIVNFIESKKIVPERDMLLVSARHAELINAARKELESAVQDAGAVSLEFTASKLRSAMNELSEILGRFDNEKVLDKVFSTFCIGK